MTAVPIPGISGCCVLPAAHRDSPSFAGDLSRKLLDGQEKSFSAICHGQQTLLAFNDLFIGRRTHVSARYNLKWKNSSESQSSSGVIVATGAGSTGWLSSVFNMMRGVNSWLGREAPAPKKLNWEDRKLVWVVREPFSSRFSQAGLVAGALPAGEELILESLMPEGGAIFSDGMEQDFLEFNSGTTARIRVADRQARIVVP